MTTKETGCVKRIIEQIDESTPALPVLHIEIRTDHGYYLERAIHGVLKHRGKWVTGGGVEWFRTSAKEILYIYDFVTEQSAPPPNTVSK